MNHNIRGYPTINVYMGTASAEETYYGDRTTDAFFSWIEHEHKVIDVVKEAKKIEPKGGLAGAIEVAKAHMHLRVKGDQGKLLGVEGMQHSIQNDEFWIKKSNDEFCIENDKFRKAARSKDTSRPSVSRVTSTCSSPTRLSTTRTR